MLSAINNQTNINNSNLAFKGKIRDKIAEYGGRLFMSQILKSSADKPRPTTALDSTIAIIRTGMMVVKPTNEVSLKELELFSKLERLNEMQRASLAHGAYNKKVGIKTMETLTKLFEENSKRIYKK